jgi:hypothetical protein
MLLIGVVLQFTIPPFQYHVTETSTDYCKQKIPQKFSKIAIVSSEHTAKRFQ